MATIVTRAGKGSPLTNNEIDANFTNLNAAIDGGGVTLDGVETLTNKTLTDPVMDGSVTEEVFTVTGSTPALSPQNGTIQKWSISSSDTPTFGAGFVSGSSFTLMIMPTGTPVITWPTVSWVGGTAPSLTAGSWNIIEFWKVDATVFGAFVGVA